MITKRMFKKELNKTEKIIISVTPYELSEFRRIAVSMGIKPVKLARGVLIAYIEACQDEENV